MENRIFENTITYGIPNIDVKVIPFVNSRWDEEIFGKSYFIVGRVRLVTFLVIYETAINLER